MKRLSIVLGFILAWASLAQSQTVGLAWDPVVVSDLASYVVYRGTASGNYSFNVDVGNVTQTTQTVPLDCTTYYFAVKAKDLAGNQSLAYSNEVSGWARVRLSTATPASLERGKTYTVTVAGANFMAGTFASNGTGLIWAAPTITNCNSTTVQVTVAADATLGPRDVEFTRTSDNVFGASTALVTVVADTTPPGIPTNFKRADKK